MGGLSHSLSELSSSVESFLRRVEHLFPVLAGEGSSLISVCIGDDIGEVDTERNILFMGELPHSSAELSSSVESFLLIKYIELG